MSYQVNESAQQLLESFFERQIQEVKSEKYYFSRNLDSYLNLITAGFLPPVLSQETIPDYQDYVKFRLGVHMIPKSNLPEPLCATFSVFIYDDQKQKIQQLCQKANIDLSISKHKFFSEKLCDFADTSRTFAFEVPQDMRDLYFCTVIERTLSGDPGKAVHFYSNEGKHVQFDEHLKPGSPDGADYQMFQHKACAKLGLPRQPFLVAISRIQFCELFLDPSKQQLRFVRPDTVLNSLLKTRYYPYSSNTELYEFVDQARRDDLQNLPLPPTFCEFFTFDIRVLNHAEVVFSSKPAQEPRQIGSIVNKRKSEASVNIIIFEERLPDNFIDEFGFTNEKSKIQRQLLQQIQEKQGSLSHNFVEFQSMSLIYLNYLLHLDAFKNSNLFHYFQQQVIPFNNNKCQELTNYFVGPIKDKLYGFHCSQQQVYNSICVLRFKLLNSGKLKGKSHLIQVRYVRYNTSENKEHNVNVISSSYSSQLQFLKSFSTTVNYHESISILYDEIKIKIPVDAQPNDFLKFEIFAIDVKLDKSKITGSVGMIERFNEVTSQGPYTLVGTGILPLFTKSTFKNIKDFGIFLLQKEYTIKLSQQTDSHHFELLKSQNKTKPPYLKLVTFTQSCIYADDEVYGAQLQLIHHVFILAHSLSKKFNISDNSAQNIYIQMEFCLNEILKCMRSVRTSLSNSSPTNALSFLFTNFSIIMSQLVYVEDVINQQSVPVMNLVSIIDQIVSYILIIFNEAHIFNNVDSQQQYVQASFLSNLIKRPAHFIEQVFDYYDKQPHIQQQFCQVLMIDHLNLINRKPMYNQIIQKCYLPAEIDGDLYILRQVYFSLFTPIQKALYDQFDQRNQKSQSNEQNQQYQLFQYSPQFRDQQLKSFFNYHCFASENQLSSIKVYFEQFSKTFSLDFEEKDKLIDYSDIHQQQFFVVLEKVQYYISILVNHQKCIDINNDINFSGFFSKVCDLVENHYTKERSYSVVYQISIKLVCIIEKLTLIISPEKICTLLKNVQTYQNVFYCLLFNLVQSNLIKIFFDQSDSWSNLVKLICNYASLKIGSIEENARCLTRFFSIIQTLSFSIDSFEKQSENLNVSMNRNYLQKVFSSFCKELFEYIKGIDVTVELTLQIKSYILCLCIIYANLLRYIQLHYQDQFINITLDLNRPDYKIYTEQQRIEVTIREFSQFHNKLLNFIKFQQLVEIAKEYQFQMQAKQSNLKHQSADVLVQQIFELRNLVVYINKLQQDYDINIVLHKIVSNMFVGLDISAFNQNISNLFTQLQTNCDKQQKANVMGRLNNFASVSNLAKQSSQELKSNDSAQVNFQQYCVLVQNIIIKQVLQFYSLTSKLQIDLSQQSMFYNNYFLDICEFFKVIFSTVTYQDQILLDEENYSNIINFFLQLFNKVQLVSHQSISNAGDKREQFTQQQYPLISIVLDYFTTKYQQDAVNLFVLILVNDYNLHKNCIISFYNINVKILELVNQISNNVVITRTRKIVCLKKSFELLDKLVQSNFQDYQFIQLDSKQSINKVINQTKYLLFDKISQRLQRNDLAVYQEFCYTQLTALSQQPLIAYNLLNEIVQSIEQQFPIEASFIQLHAVCLFAETVFVSNNLYINSYFNSNQILFNYQRENQFNVGDVIIGMLQFILPTLKPVLDRSTVTAINDASLFQHENKIYNSQVDFAFHLFQLLHNMQKKFDSLRMFHYKNIIIQTINLLLLICPNLQYDMKSYCRNSINQVELRNIVMLKQDLVVQPLLFNQQQSGFYYLVILKNFPQVDDFNNLDGVFVYHSQDDQYKFRDRITGQYQRIMEARDEYFNSKFQKSDAAKQNDLLSMKTVSLLDFKNGISEGNFVIASVQPFYFFEDTFDIKQSFSNQVLSYIQETQNKKGQPQFFIDQHKQLNQLFYIQLPHYYNNNKNSIIHQGKCFTFFFTNQLLPSQYIRGAVDRENSIFEMILPPLYCFASAFARQLIMVREVDANLRYLITREALTTSEIDFINNQVLHVISGTYAVQVGNGLAVVTEAFFTANKLRAEVLLSSKIVFIEESSKVDSLQVPSDTLINQSNQSKIKSFSDLQIKQEQIDDIRCKTAQNNLLDTQDTLGLSQDGDMSLSSNDAQEDLRKRKDLHIEIPSNSDSSIESAGIQDYEAFYNVDQGLEIQQSRLQRNILSANLQDNTFETFESVVRQEIPEIQMFPATQQLTETDVSFVGRNLANRQLHLEIQLAEQEALFRTVVGELLAIAGQIFYNLRKVNSKHKLDLDKHIQVFETEFAKQKERIDRVCPRKK